jgi:hypothetical protein
MKHAGPSCLLLLTSFVGVNPCVAAGQDPDAARKVAGLKGLHTVAVVVRNNAPREFITPREWGETVEIALRRAIPGLELADTEHAPAWIEVNVITTDAGCYLELSVQRWTRLVESGEDTFSKVWWDSELEIGRISRSGLQESLDGLLKSFAADYARAREGSGGPGRVRESGGR